MIHPIFTYVLTTAKKNSSAGAAAKLWPLSTFTLLPAVFLQCCYIHVAINQCCLLWHFLSALCLCMSNFPTCRLTICPHFNIKRVEKFQQKLRSTLFENHPQYPLGISHLWHFPPIFVLLKSSCIQICSRCWMRLFFMIIQHRRNGYCEMNTHFDVSADINHLWPRIRGCCYCQRLRMHTHTTERYSPLFLLLHQQQQRWHDEISSILKVNDTPFSPPLKVKGVEKGCVTKCPMGSVF